jgi:hypothetical protein
VVLQAFRFAKAAQAPARAAVLIAFGVFPVGIVAQTSPAVDQIGSRSGAAAARQLDIPSPQQAGGAHKSMQVAPTGLARSNQIIQTGGPETSAGMTQATDASDRGLTVPALSPEMIDVCEAVLMGRRAAPPGIDCHHVVEATAAAAQIESNLLPRPEAVADLQGTGGEVSIRRLDHADPEEIARRLATGYLVNAPAAQAVGASQAQQTPATPGVTVIPDPRAPANAPPVVVSQGPR